jgi:hypothetical protein
MNIKKARFLAGVVARGVWDGLKEAREWGNSFPEEGAMSLS